jgi:hypothetical protein
VAHHTTTAHLHKLLATAWTHIKGSFQGGIAHGHASARPGHLPPRKVPCTRTQHARLCSSTQTKVTRETPNWANKHGYSWRLRREVGGDVCAHSARQLATQWGVIHLDDDPDKVPDTPGEHNQLGRLLSSHTTTTPTHTYPHHSMLHTHDPLYSTQRTPQHERKGPAGTQPDRRRLEVGYSRAQAAETRSPSSRLLNEGFTGDNQ